LNIITCFQYLAYIGSSLLQHIASIWKQVPVRSCKSNPFDHSQPHSARTYVHLFALLLITGRAALNLNIDIPITTTLVRAAERSSTWSSNVEDTLSRQFGKARLVVSLGRHAYLSAWEDTLSLDCGDDHSCLLFQSVL
jgi:hypothetical protein